MTVGSFLRSSAWAKHFMGIPWDCGGGGCPDTLPGRSRSGIRPGSASALGDIAVRYLVAVLACLTLVLTGAVTAQPPAKPPLRIAVVPKGTTHEFWRSIHAGAIK